MQTRLTKQNSITINFERSLSPVPNNNDLDLSDSFENFFY